jgi:hypothetical protein
MLFGLGICGKGFEEAIPVSRIADICRDVNAFITASILSISSCKSNFSADYSLIDGLFPILHTLNSRYLPRGLIPCC